MINIEEFQEICSSGHLIVLDTNVLLELYRQPANISLDVINALKKIQSNIYIPRQVYDEYLKNYHKTCGDEKKKYKKVTKELSDSLKNLQDDIAKKIGEYRKHNYTDISKLQNNLNEKIKDTQNIITEFEKNHYAEIQLNIDFLQNDKVKEFVDLLHNEGNIGEKIPFSKKLLLLQEGQVRYDNLIPPGFRDSTKNGEAKYGDLFVWKDIITIAKAKNSNIIFVCNDIKEDWWEKNKDTPFDLRQELEEEFKETNPTLSINFLTLDKFFSYLSEKLKLGKSKSALQLSALDDTKEMLPNYEDKISQSIRDYLMTINIEKELDEEFLETGDENLYWSIADVSVEKENKNVTYYVNLDISVLADLVYQEDGDYPYDAGKIALALIGEIEISMEEYSTEKEIKTTNIEKSDILHIEPEIWNIVKNMENRDSCREIISTSKNLIKIQETTEKINENIDINGLGQALQQYATLYEKLEESIKPTQTNKVFSELAKQVSLSLSAIKPLQTNEAFSELAKQASLNLSTIKPLQAGGAFSELAKQASLSLSALKPLHMNEAFPELTKQLSANKKTTKPTDESE